MYYLVIKVYSTKTGEYVIAPHKTNDPAKFYNPPILWSRRNFHFLKMEVLYFAVDWQDAVDTTHKSMESCKDDPLFRNNWTAKPRKKRIFKEESRIRYRLAKLGVRWTPEIKAKASATVKLQFRNGRKQNVSMNRDFDAIREKIKKHPYNTNRPREKCPHCGGVYAVNMVGYRHKDNCKFNW